VKIKSLALAAATVLFVACTGGATSSPTPVSVNVQVADFKITPATIAVTGTTFSFDVRSQGPTPHNFNIRDDSGTLASTVDLHTGDSDTIGATLAPGTYTYFCAFPGHESLGMHGTLTVTAP
jgi:plastocyanin